MKRRNFLKTTAAGSAFVFAAGACTFKSGNTGKALYAYQSERKIPIVYDVDVVVIGGSVAGVAAAVEASRAGAKVFLAAQEPYLGEDISGTFRLWNNDSGVINTELGSAIWSKGLPSQQKVKKTLDDALIDNDVDFLYSCFVSDILSDEAGNPAGIVMSNRSGRQAIVAKTIIDATPRALVARMAGVEFPAYPAGRQKFQFTVVGNRVKKAPGLSAKIQGEPVVSKYTYNGDPLPDNEDFSAIEYSLDIDMKDGSLASFAEAEQVARDFTWDNAQVESADLLFQNPPDKMTAKGSCNDLQPDPGSISLKVFQPRNTDNIFVLSGSAGLSYKAAEKLLEPGNMIGLGERIGKEAAEISAAKADHRGIKLKGETKANTVPGDVGELLDGFRSNMNTGEVFAEETSLPVLGEYDVVVLGAGTAGAPAAVGAAQKGARTLVVEYLHGMGGMGTFGMIGSYFHGYREGYTNIVDKGINSMGPAYTNNLGEGHPKNKTEKGSWAFDWKTEYFRKEIRKAGGEIWFGIVGVGAYYENNRVKGLVVATPYGRAVVLANTVIDSTGSADTAICAGAAYDYTGAASVALQGSGVSQKNPNEFYNNSDWTFIDDGDMLDVWRSFVVARDKYKGQYDIGKIPQTRERRRVVGDFTISVLDVYNGRTYPDTISIHKSSFDTHGFTEDPFFSIKPPSHIHDVVTACVPLRALLPKGLDGIIVTGLGASAHRDAMPVIRMQPCLQNQGYSVGLAAAIVAQKRQDIRFVDIKSLQKELVELENLPGSVLTDKDNYPPEPEEIKKAAQSLLINKDMEGLETVLWNRESGLQALTKEFNSVADRDHKLVYARILGMYGVSAGWKELASAINAYEKWDKGWNYTGMGQFGESISYLDSLIIAAGRTKNREVLPGIFELMKKLTAESEFSHFRAVAIAAETVGDTRASKHLYNLLQMPGVSGHTMKDIETVKELTPESKVDVTTRNNSLRELILARALYRCGDFNGEGKQILNDYSKDLRGHYYRHSSGVLDE